MDARSRADPGVAQAQRAMAVIRTREADPNNWAATEDSLGAGFGARIRGDRAETQEREIACYEAALHSGGGSKQVGNDARRPRHRVP